MQMWMYQKDAGKTAQYPGRGDLDGLLYTTLGLAGEAGEIANKVKKIMRDDSYILTDEMKKAIKKELGDLLWYFAETCTNLELDMSEIAHENLLMLKDRQVRDVIKGSGDDR